MKATPSHSAVRPLKLSEMGTGGLLQWIAAGESAARAKNEAAGGWRLNAITAVYRLRTGQAAKVILARYGAEAAAIFRAVAKREHAARESVARLAAGGCVACFQTTYESLESRVTIKELCRLAGRDFDAAVTEAREHVATAAEDADTSNARAFLAAI